MAFQIEPGENLNKGLRRILREETRGALDQLGKAVKKKRAATESVHNTRKNLKKLRAVLRLLTPLAKKKKCAAVDKTLRDTGRLLSVARDAQVLASTFDEISKRKPKGARPSRAAVRISGYLRKRHSEAGADLAGHARLKRLKTELKAAGKFLDRLAKKADLETVCASIGKIYAAARLAMRAADRLQSPEAFHEWRKRVKDLWYQLCLIGQAGSPTFAPEIERLRKLETALGRGHDSAVLEQHLTDNFAKKLPSAELKKWIDLLVAERMTLQSEAFGWGHETFANEPADFRNRVDLFWQTRGEAH